MHQERDQNAPQFEPLGAFEFESCSCPVCGRNDVGKRLTKTVQGVEMHFGFCVGCSTLYSNPRLTRDSLKMLYSTSEFFEGAEDNLNYYSFLAGEQYLRRTARGRIDRFRSLAPGKRLLEVASAAGFFLVEAKAAGFECQGIEISAPMAAYASQRWEVPVRPASIEEVDLEDESFDVIASWGVMTIIRDPKALIAKFHRALRPGGVWVFNTYDNHSLWGRAFGKRWYILVPNTNQIHNDQTLRSLIDAAGFDLVAKRHDRPYASVERLLFVLATHLGDQRVPRKVFDRIHALNRLVVPAIAPDAFEYVCVKR
jgi:SAM-dependent methyltransferase